MKTDDRYELNPVMSDIANRRYTASVYLAGLINNEEKKMTARQERLRNVSLILMAQTLSDEFVYLADLIVSEPIESVGGSPITKMLPGTKTSLFRAIMDNINTVSFLPINIAGARGNAKTIKAIIDSFAEIVNRLRRLVESGAKYVIKGKAYPLLNNESFISAAWKIHDKCVNLLKSGDIVDENTKKKLILDVAAVKKSLDAIKEPIDYKTGLDNITRLSSRDIE
jgi:hypothetical protein